MHGGVYKSAKVPFFKVPFFFGFRSQIVCLIRNVR